MFGICVDRQNLTKFASQLLNKETVIRDKHRFHYFKSGQWSCGESRWKQLQKKHACTLFQWGLELSVHGRQAIYVYSWKVALPIKRAVNLGSGLVEGWKKTRSSSFSIQLSLVSKLYIPDKGAGTLLCFTFIFHIYDALVSILIWRVHNRISQSNSKFLFPHYTLYLPIKWRKFTLCLGCSLFNKQNESTM